MERALESAKPAALVLFDITVLGAVRRAPTSRRLEGLDVPSEIRYVVQQLHAAGVRIGVVSGEGDELAGILEASPLASLLDRQLLLAAGDLPRELLPETASSGEVGPPSAPPPVLVATDRNDRRRALEDGFRACPHPRLAWPVVQGMRLRYVRLTVPALHGDAHWRPAVLALPFVPVHVEGEGGRTVYGITTNAAATQLDDLGFLVDRLGGEDDPLATDVYLLRDDRQVRSGFLAPEGSSTARFGDDADPSSVLSSTAEGLYVALPAGRSVETYHFEQALHGHTERLLPDVSLLQPMAVPGPAALRAGDEEPGLSGDEKRALADLTPELLAADLARYMGAAPIDSSAPRTLHSRHILHGDNALAVESLAKDLQAIGEGRLGVRLHEFRHEGHVLHNIEATLVAESDELVLVTAHMDCTAAFSPGYDAERHDAPGADDDATGISAVLNVARVLCGLAGSERPKRTLRFVLFNAEEHGLVGSKAYAGEQAGLRAPIVAVFQIDMIGFNRQPPRTFEVHAGFVRSSEVQDRSLILARRIGRMVQEVSSGLEAPQLYPNQGLPERDPADGRSDHSSFQSVGYAACAVTEDFFAGPGPDAPDAEPNPNYHTTSDTVADQHYAADIARAVAGAAWVTARM